MHRATTRRAIALIGVVGSLATVVPATGATAAADPPQDVIVRTVPGATAEVQRWVETFGGTVERELRIIDGFSATVPAGVARALATRSDVVAVNPDRTMQPLQAAAYEPATDLGSMSTITRVTGAQDAWLCGLTGRGVDVALIDTGVAPVPGIGRVVNGPDLSFDVVAGNPAGVDGYGHGTHLASLIAGRDPSFAVPTGQCRVLTGQRSTDGIAPLMGFNDGRAFAGIAPDARIVNVKVGAADGAVDVSQVIAGIEWVVENRRANGLNIRVINLSYGTDATQDWRNDPLSYAVQVAWNKGIVVVAAAGNDGTTATQLANPARNPFIIAVGALDFGGSLDRSTWKVASFASRGTAERGPDLIVPGVSVVGLRVPGSFADTFFPGGRAGDRFMRASGTSQAAALTSGLAALVLQLVPSATPNQVKAILTASGARVGGQAEHQGAGGIDGTRFLQALTRDLGRLLTLAFSANPDVSGWGRGTLQGARGTSSLVVDDVALTGEVDVWAKKWAASTWASAAWSEKNWSGGAWRGTTLTANGTTTGNWGPVTWSGTDWAGRRWSSGTWTGPWAADAWVDGSWAGRRWSGTDWAGRRWSSDGWSGRRWSSGDWTGRRWSSAGWQ